MDIDDYKGRIREPLLDKFNEEAEAVKLNKKQKEEALRRLEEEYKKSLIHPGESIGVITAESFGEPSTQMSIHHNEKIIVKIKNKIRITKISEFVDNFMAMNGAIKISEDSEVLPIEDLDIFVPSINQDEKIEWKRVVELSRHKSLNKLIKLTTASGRGIVATDNHSFVTRLNNMVVPIIGKGLRTGDRIPVMKYLPEHCASLLTVSNYVNLPNEDSFRVTRSYRPTKLIPKELKLDWNFGWFIGAYLAEGNATSGQVSISNLDDNYIKNAKKFLDDLELDYREKHHHRGFAPSRDLTVNSSLLARLISTTCESGSFNKHVPEFAYSAKDEFAAGLLRAYFDGDSNFHADRNLIRASSNSKELIDGIALLLSRFKIFSYKVKDKKNQYWLLIPYKYAPLFLAHIGSDIDYKLKALEKMSVKSKKFWNNYSRDYTDMISGFGDLFYRTAKKLNYPTRYVNNFTKRQKIGRTALYRYIKLFEKLAKEKNVDINNELKVMHRMFNSDVVWDEIVNIEYVDNEYEYVYDLSVPGLETFTTFDGLITHNTLNTFHFAGVAELQISLGLPRLIEILDGRENISTPFMEIFLKKPYNQDQDKVKEVATELKETKLKEISSEFAVNAIKLQVEVTLDKKAMKNLKITDKYLLDTLSEELKGISIKQLSNGNLVFKPKEETKELDLKEIYKLKEKIKDVYVKGVSGIKQVLPVKQTGEFVILTSGSNLKEVMMIKEVDATRITTNNIHEIAKILGIDAAREAIIAEALKVIRDQGIDIDIRHIMFIADLMTTSGNIKGMTRSGITSDKESVLARASFETPIKHIINASLIGEQDYLNSVIENVIMNQPVPLGTGLPKLVSNVKIEEKKEK